MAIDTDIYRYIPIYTECVFERSLLTATGKTRYRAAPRRPSTQRVTLGETMRNVLWISKKP